MNKQDYLCKRQIKRAALALAVLSALPSYATAEPLTLETLQKQIEKQQRQIEQLTQQQAPSKSTTGLVFKSYGNLVYRSDPIFANTQDINPTRRATTDLERIVTEFEYQLAPNWEVEFEIEYEHGGTGSTLEYDGFEEFGEFETEVEAGGEVIVEKLQFHYLINDHFSAKFGRIYVPVGLGTVLNKPTEHVTTSRHWSEASLIPQVWHETGFNLISSWDNFTLQTLVTTGLNSEYFRTTNWVAGGLQQRFEDVNADDLALTLRLDYGDIRTNGLGASFYRGNTSGNRRNLNKLSEDGALSIFALSGAWQWSALQVRGQYLYGELSDSQLITTANKTTPGLKPGNFAQIGSKAESFYLEAALHAQSFINTTQDLQFFVAYDYANPVKAVASGRATARFDISEVSVGVNYYPTDNLVVKLQASDRHYAQTNLDNTTHVSASVGYVFNTHF